MITKILLYREKNLVVCMNKHGKDITVDLVNLQWRTRFNPELHYYILEYDDSYNIPLEAFIQVIKCNPDILNKSGMIKEI